ARAPRPRVAPATRPADARRGCHVFAQGVAVPRDSESGVICDDGRGVGVLVTVGVHSSSIGTNGVDAGVFESRASARLDRGKLTIRSRTLAPPTPRLARRLRLSTAGHRGAAA